jgi:LysM repeat protein
MLYATICPGRATHWRHILMILAQTAGGRSVNLAQTFMNRRQLAFVIILNAIISLVVALAVVWVVEARRPDPEALAAIYTPLAAPVAATFTPTPLTASAPQSTEAQPDAQAQAPTSAPDAAGDATGDDNVYVVQVGDSLSGIADRFGVAVAAIVEANKLDNPDVLFSGQRLEIPSSNGGPAPTATPAQITAATGIRLSPVLGSGDLNNEVIGIINDSDLAVNLQGWRIEREGGPAYNIGSVTMFPGSGIQLHSGPGTNTSIDLYWNQPSAVWGAGAVARLLNGQGAEIARLSVP